VDHETMKVNVLARGAVRQGRVTHAYADDARRGMLIGTKVGLTQ
jgi:hypothetical protein